MSTIAVNAITDASGGSTASINGYTPTVSNMAGRNKILNGAMVIDQRNAGASVTPATSGTFLTDRWQTQISQASKLAFQQNRGSVTPPAGFTNYLGAATVSPVSVGASDFFTLLQTIEGFNVSDLAWGTANAQAATLSFRVYSSLTGTFGGAIYNVGFNRSYPFTYTVLSANTWNTVSITIPGDTTGTWNTGNGIGMGVSFGLGAGSTYSGTAGSWAGSGLFSATGATSVVGTSGATFYITGVQLEAGSVATPFENVDYSEMLRRCQRYYEVKGVDGSGFAAVGYYYGANSYWYDWQFKVTKRATPTITGWSGVTNYPSVEHCQFNDLATSFVSSEPLTASAEL